MVNTTTLDQLIQSNAATFASETDAQVAADPMFTTPTTTPNTSAVTFASLGSLWGTAKAIEAQTALQAAITDGGATGAAAAYALNVLAVGFNPSDPASPALLATLGAYLIAATASSPTPIVQADIDAISVTTSYRTGDVPQASDVTASRARIAGRTNNAALVAWLKTVGPALIQKCQQNLADVNNNVAGASTALTKASLTAIMGAM
jgi:hypothetical protein